LNLAGSWSASKVCRNRFVLFILCAFALTCAAAPKSPDKATSALEQYAGVYHSSGKEFYSIAVFDPGEGEKQLLLTNLESGLIRMLAPGADDVFTAGPGFLVTKPAELQIRFRRNKERDVVGLAGDGNGVSKEEAKKLETRREEVTIRNDEIALAGTLVRPDAKTPCPAVVFLHGSGPLNRYSFGPLPDFFFSRGCAVLTYDKRSTGGSNGKFDAASLEDLASDGRAAVEFLKKQEGIAKIGLCGSSQGGFLAAAVASGNRDVRRQGIIEAAAKNFCVVQRWSVSNFRVRLEGRAQFLHR
jgi:hypothetical protein